MRVLDLRPWWLRTAAALWSGRRGAAAARLAAGWEAIVRQWMDRRVRGRRPPPGGPYVVSVGNLALGGTGKTPVVAALARDLAAAGLRTAVATRGYGSPLRGPVLVDPQDERAADEARWLAARLLGSGCPVVQARDRAAGAAAAAALQPAPQVLILEDGHQSAGAGRHLDVLILDRWQVRSGASAACVAPEAGPVVPLGPWREGPQGARRAQVWLLETADDVAAAGCWGQEVAAFRRRAQLAPCVAGAPLPPADVPWAALSGIARPEAFEAGAAALLGRPPALVVRGADHQRYGAAVVARIAAAVAAAGARALVTTEKDWVKLAPAWRAPVPAFLVVQEVRWGNGTALPEVVLRERRKLLGPGYSEATTP